MTAEQIEPRYWSGGCQCGAVRYKVEGPLDEVSVCYCRMCQKATGGAFGLFVGELQRGRITLSGLAERRRDDLDRFRAPGVSADGRRLLFLVRVLRA